MMATQRAEATDLLRIDAKREIERIATTVRKQIGQQLHRRGAVVGLSGGIDSSVTASLMVEALGPDRVFGLYMPEGESSDESLTLAQELADQLGIETLLEDITPTLIGAGCYRRRDEAIQSVVSDYGEGWKAALVRSGVLEQDAMRHYSVVAVSPEGNQLKKRLPPKAFLEIVAATSFKQRARKMMEYYHADRLNYAVAGTPNRLEYELGFFVKNGDGAADVKPIAHLYKSQVYALAEALGVPEGIRSRPSTTDTYPIEGAQDEFFFPLPLAKMDLCLYARNHGLSAAEIAPTLGLSADQVERVFRDIDQRKASARSLGMAPLTVEPLHA